MAFLSCVGLGAFPCAPDKFDIQMVELPARVKVVHSMDEALACFPQEVADGQPLLFLSPFHLNVDAFNVSRVAALQRGHKSRSFNSYHTFPTQCDGVDSIESYTSAGCPPHRLDVFVGMRVSLLRNILPSKKLSNGSILTVLDFTSNTITCLSPIGEKVDIPRISFSYLMGTIPVTRRQFPFVPAYGATVNKAQGETLPRVILDLSAECFMHGQLYVALSRVRCCEDIVVIAPSRKQIRSVVYKEILRAAKLINI